MKNPCGKNKEIGSMNPLSHKTGGKLGQVFGKKGTVKKFITGGK